MGKVHIFLISVILVWLFTISGIIGISLGYQDWFLALTPLQLLVYFGVILWNDNSKNTIMVMFIPISIGWVVEFLGVRYGWIFGSYIYGNHLGYKIAGVPLMIGINWAILTYCSAAIAFAICTSIRLTRTWNLIISVVLAALFMTLLDVSIEVSAPRFDFWEFEGGTVPLQNYLGWFLTAIVIQCMVQKNIKSYHFGIAAHVFMAIFIFFTAFLIL